MVHRSRTLAALHLFHAGHYAHSLGQFAAACTHFKAVLASDATPLHNTALLAAALSELQVRLAGW